MGLADRKIDIIRLGQVSRVTGSIFRRQQEISERNIAQVNLQVSSGSGQYEKIKVIESGDERFDDEKIVILTILSLIGNKYKINEEITNFIEVVSKEDQNITKDRIEVEIINFIAAAKSQGLIKDINRFVVTHEDRFSEKGKLFLYRIPHHNTNMLYDALWCGYFKVAKYLLNLPETVSGQSKTASYEIPISESEDENKFNSLFVSFNSSNLSSLSSPEAKSDVLKLVNTQEMLSTNIVSISDSKLYSAPSHSKLADPECAQQVLHVEIDAKDNGLGNLPVASESPSLPSGLSSSLSSTVSSSSSSSSPSLATSSTSPSPSPILSMDDQNLSRDSDTTETEENIAEEETVTIEENIAKEVDQLVKKEEETSNWTFSPFSLFSCCKPDAEEEVTVRETATCCFFTG